MDFIYCSSVLTLNVVASSIIIKSELELRFESISRRNVLLKCAKCRSRTIICFKIMFHVTFTVIFMSP